MEALLLELDPSRVIPTDVSESVPSGPMVGPPKPPEQNVSQQIIQQRAAEESDEEPEVVDEFEKFVIEQAYALTDLVLANCEEDRAEATASINMIKELISSQDKVVHGGTISRLLQAIDTRSGISLTVVKMMETQAKILSARKGPAKQVNNTTNATAVGNNTLIEILEAGLRDKKNAQG